MKHQFTGRSEATSARTSDYCLTLHLYNVPPCSLPEAHTLLTVSWEEADEGENDRLCAEVLRLLRSSIARPDRRRRDERELRP